MAIENPDLVVAYHQVTGERREVPEHFLGAKSPFPGQWGKTAPKITEPAAPAKNASRQEWADYALTLSGVTEADLEGKSRDDLAAAYAPKEG